MNLKALLRDLDILNPQEIPDISIADIAYDSRKVSPGALFIALPGLKTDGHGFIADAISRGALAILSEKPADARLSVPLLRIGNARQALARVSSRFFDEPTADLPVVGVTGTNGKTTVTYLLEAILKADGRSPAVMGTVNYRHGSQIHAAPHTTPEAYDLQRFVKGAKDTGCNALVMEVSSHALDLHRADGVHFDAAVFTNLSPEHLDYHRDMEDYFRAKLKLFEELLKESGKKEKTAVVNGDDPFAKRLVAKLSHAKILTYSLDSKQGASLFPLSYDLSLQGIQARIQTPLGLIELSSSLLGAFNLSNLLAAAAAALALNIPLKTIERGLQGFKTVPGRLESVANALGLHLFVDYAHTPDALKNVLFALRSLLEKNPNGDARLITVFGCGGDRDRSKRPLMGSEVARGADGAIVTSDNPRTENPDSIIGEILPGLNIAGWKMGRDFKVEPDRRKAIAEAIGEAKPGDVILIAGKGHEDYQIIGTEKFHFDDREVAKEVLENRKEKVSTRK